MFRYIPKCGIHAPPPPHPAGILDFAIWLEQQKIARGEIPENTHRVNTTWVQEEREHALEEAIETGVLT